MGVELPQEKPCLSSPTWLSRVYQLSTYLCRQVHPRHWGMKIHQSINISTSNHKHSHFAQPELSESSCVMLVWTKTGCVGVKQNGPGPRIRGIHKLEKKIGYKKKRASWSFHLRKNLKCTMKIDLKSFTKKPPLKLVDSGGLWHKT